MPDPLRQAYATLGVPQDASRRTLKARRKALVRQWHPDRFQNDPMGQAEATERMRAINDAYETVLDSLSRKSPSPPAPSAHPIPRRPAPPPTTTGPHFTSFFPPRSYAPLEDTPGDKTMRFCLGAILGGVAAHRVVVLWAPANDLLAAGLLALPAVAVGIAFAQFGHRFLDWLAEPRL